MRAATHCSQACVAGCTDQNQRTPWREDAPTHTRLGWPVWASSDWRIIAAQTFAACRRAWAKAATAKTRKVVDVRRKYRGITVPSDQPKQITAQSATKRWSSWACFRTVYALRQHTAYAAGPICPVREPKRRNATSQMLPHARAELNAKRLQDTFPVLRRAPVHRAPVLCSLWQIASLAPDGYVICARWDGVLTTAASPKVRRH